jgi:exopolysaccharide biosynthesis polyprenyl glycosylphosphotransferase
LTNPVEPVISQSGARKGARVYAAIATLLLADVALLSVTALAGFLFKTNFLSNDMTMAETKIALWVPATFVAIAAVCLALIDSQQSRPKGFSVRELAHIIGVISFASLITWVLAEAVLPEKALALELAVTVWALTLITLPVGRVVVRQALYARGIGCKRVVVVGDITLAMPLIEQLSKNGSPYRVAGMVSATNARSGRILSVVGGTEAPSAPLQDLSNLPQVMRETRATEVLIAVSNGQYASVRDAVKQATPSDTNVHVAINPLLDEAATGEASEIAEGVPAVRLKGPNMPWQYETVKRGFDVAAALFILILASPLLAMLAIAIKLDSKGPVFFRQPRIGRNARPFGMYKFRSMRLNAEAMLPELMKQNEASGAMFKMRNDPRITRVGKVIRKLSLDELPQLFNVLNGTMSLVGPRPPLPREVAQYEERHYERLGGVPGITGLWQVKRGPVLDFNEMFMYDLEYLRTWSLKNDLVIMLKTVPVVITGRGAY